MDFRLFIKFQLLLFVLTAFLQIRAQGTGSILFLDSPGHRYLRSTSSAIDGDETNSMSSSEVASAISVLLGFAPSASLLAESSSKLDDVLLPNPFDRPRAVFVLEARGIEDSVSVHCAKAQMGNAFTRKALIGSNKAEIDLPDNNEVAVVSLDETLAPECDAACADQELQDLAYWLGGSYGDGELTISLPSGASLTLQISRNADRAFAMGLASLVRNIKKAVETHENFARSLWNPAELLTGRFTGLEVLQEEYGPVSITKQGTELFIVAVTKLFDLLQAAYKGHIVGVILINGKSYPELGTVLNVKTPTRMSRWLEEASPVNKTLLVEEVLLVRRSLAWITGIILLVSTLIGIYYLLYMPLTRDTLLYSNVKLD